MNFNSFINEKGIKLETELLTNDQKETIYQALINKENSDPEKTFKFVKEFNLNENKLYDSAKEVFKGKNHYNSEWSFKHGLSFVKNENLDVNKLTDLSQEIYDERLNLIEDEKIFPNSTPWDYLELAGFAKDMGLSEKLISQHKDKMIPEFIDRGNIESALKAAEITNDSMKDSLKKIYEVIKG